MKAFQPYLTSPSRGRNSFLPSHFGRVGGEDSGRSHPDHRFTEGKPFPAGMGWRESSYAPTLASTTTSAMIARTASQAPRKPIQPMRSGR